MCKKLLFVLSLIVASIIIVPSYGQSVKQLPRDPKVRYGVLDNGLTYYIRHNETPKHRADFHIAQKVGSILEEENQRGLAHFLEHMAFNGTKNYPGKDMLNYLEKNGMKFGGDINAYTSIDETVYRITNVPTSREALLDSALLVLHDWSNSLLLDDNEIDNERGVIEEEWRTRNDAGQRTIEAILPILFKDSKYAYRLPIGTMEVVKNFPYKALRDYYHKWYRPDQQAIVVVGDIDVDAMEKKIKEMFSPIKMPENPAKREYFPVPDNKDMIYALYTDPETTKTSFNIFFKHDVFPDSLKNTVTYMATSFANSIASIMLSNRFRDLALEPNAPFNGASASDSQYYVAKTKDAYTASASVKTGKVMEAFEEVMRELNRVKQHGFTASEYERAKANFLSMMENAYTERNNNDNDSYAQEYIRNFTDGEFIPGIEVEYEMYKMLASKIDVNTINSMYKQYIKDDNVAVMVTGPKKDGVSYPTKNEIEKAFTDISNEKLEAYIDNVVKEPLLDKKPTAGTIKSKKYDAKLNVTELKLSNGATVYLKPTDFKNDEIIMSAASIGGKWAYKGKNALDLNIFNMLMRVNALGKFTKTELSKQLAGVNAKADFTISDTGETVSASCVNKDVETMMQLVYLTFTDMRKDDKAYNAFISSLKTSLANLENNPNTVFSDSLSAKLRSNPLYKSIKLKDVDNINYDNVMTIAKERLANAGDFQFSFVGSFNVDSIIPYIEQYIAALPDNGKREKIKYTVPLNSGNIKSNFDYAMENPKTTVYKIYNGKIKYSMADELKLEILSEVMDIKYIATIREEEGGTYGVSVDSNISPFNNQWMFLYAFDTNSEMRDKLNDRASKELADVVANGIDEVTFNKVVGNMKKEYAQNIRENKFWLSVLRQKVYGIDAYSLYEQTLNTVTVEDVNKFIKTLFPTNNTIEVIMTGVKN